MSGAIANGPDQLITSIKRGQTVETRNETQLRALFKQYDQRHKSEHDLITSLLNRAEDAHRNGDEAFDMWVKEFRGSMKSAETAYLEAATANRAMIVDLGVAVTQGGKANKSTAA